MNTDSESDEEDKYPYNEREEEADTPDQSFDSVKSKRGRKAIPTQWSRVISISKDDLSDLKVYELAPDLLLSNAVTATLTRGKIG